MFRHWDLQQFCIALSHLAARRTGHVQKGAALKNHHPEILAAPPAQCNIHGFYSPLCLHNNVRTQTSRW